MEDLSENARVALRGAEALSDRDLEAMLEVAHPEIEYVTHPGFVGQPAAYRGHDGVRPERSEGADTTTTVTMP